MRLRLFNDIETRLSRVRLVGDKVIYCRPEPGNSAKLPGVPAINHTGLWNENTTRLTQSRPFAPPAVFVEFLPAQWSSLGRSAVHCDMTVRMHVVTATLAATDTSYRNEALQRFRLIRAIKSAFAGFSGEADDKGRSYSTFHYLECLTDHNHEQITEDIEGWRTHCVDATDTVYDGYLLTPHNVTLEDGNMFAGFSGEEHV